MSSFANDRGCRSLSRRAGSPYPGSGRMYLVRLSPSTSSVGVHASGPSPRPGRARSAGRPVTCTVPLTWSIRPGRPCGSSCRLAEPLSEQVLTLSQPPVAVAAMSKPWRVPDLTWSPFNHVIPAKKAQRQPPRRRRGSVAGLAGRHRQLPPSAAMPQTACNRRARACRPTGRQPPHSSTWSRHVRPPADACGILGPGPEALGLKNDTETIPMFSPMVFPTPRPRSSVG